MKGRSHRLQSSDPPDDWVNGSWVVDCVCGVNFDDGEEMVNCDECGVWVHTRCSRYVKGDDIFVCDKCKIKNSRNDSEETEVAQLLVELPTKTVRMESSYGPPPNVTTRRPFRLWTDIPMEERVHVQGIPGGDPAIFGGLSSVFTPELWKSTGYVPKKFNFQYREFPCWDEKKEDDARFDEDNDNAVDKGAGVLFSLLKESVLANPVAALVGMRGREENRGYDKRVSLKETKRWDNEVVDHRCAQSGVKKERSLFRPVVLHSGKRKKDDLGTSKDRSGKKKARAAEKEADAKKRGGQSSKSVFTPTSDAKQLEFSEDRGPKISKANKKLSNSVVREPASDVCLAADYTVGKHSSEASISDMSYQKLSIGDGVKEDKIGHQVPSVLGNITISKTDEAVASLSEHNDAGTDCVKEEGDSTADDNLDAKAPFEEVAGTAPEVKDQVQYPTDDLSVQPYSKVKTEEHDDNSRNPLNVHGDAKGLGVSSDHMSEGSKVNDVTVNSPLSSDHNVQGADRTSEAVGDSQTDKGDELSGDPCLLKPELEGSGGSMTLQKSSSDPKHGLGIAKELSEPGGTIVNSPAVPSQCKTVACAGKSSTISSTIVIPKPSTSGNLKSGDAQNPNPIAKQRVMSESNVNIKKDRALCEDVDEDRDNMPRKTVKEQLRSPTDSSPKTSHLSRNSYDSTSKWTTSESKDLVQYSSSKTSPVGNTVVPSVPSEPAGSLPSQKVLHAQNKSSASSASQRGEKLNQTISSKTYQNHAPSACPPAPSSSHAPLSDEELALLLHQELNSSPRVPRVPRVRHASSLPQLASPSATSMLTKRTTSSGGKDPSSVSRRKVRDASKDGLRGSRELDDEAKRTDRVLSSPDQRRQDAAYTADAATKREDNGSSTVVHSVKKNIHSASTATAHSGPSSSTEANDRNVSSVRSSPRNASDDDTGAVGPVHRTLPGLINEIMSKGKRMTYEELCNAVLPHWHNLRKHNGERYAYTSHSQAVLDCLRNRHEWARLVDRGPKTNSSRKKRKLDAEDSEDNEYGRGKNPKELEGKSIETQREDFPKGKRKARKRRRLALQGRGIKNVREKRKADLLTDDDVGPSFSNSSEGSMSSEDDIQGGGAGPVGSEASSSSDEAGTT